MAWALSYVLLVLLIATIATAIIGSISIEIDPANGLAVGLDWDLETILSRR